MSEIQDLLNGDKDAFGAMHADRLRAVVADALACGCSPNYIGEYLSDMGDTLWNARLLNEDEMEEYGDECKECGTPYLADFTGDILCVKCDKEAGESCDKEAEE